MLYIGIMSGTSLDGTDVAFAEIDVRDANPRRPCFGVRLIASGFAPYPDALRARLQSLRHGLPTAIAEVAALHYALADVYADAVEQAAGDAAISLADVAAVGLHGQTVWHAPPSSGASILSTLQLGQPVVLAERLGVTVVSDFRARDIAAGGEGAPLVPFADFVLLAAPDEDRVILNLGGIANVTWLPAGSSLDDVLAFDTGPGNLIVDGLASALTGQSLDADGALAASGTPDDALLADLLALPYFALPPPKSTGAELFDAAFVARLLDSHLSPADLMATATALTVQSIARALADFLPRLPARVIVGGGGAHNRTLMAGLRAALPGVIFDTHDAHGIPGDAKEALAFALLACATLNGIPSNVPSATGARGPRVLGTVTRG